MTDNFPKDMLLIQKSPIALRLQFKTGPVKIVKPTIKSKIFISFQTLKEISLVTLFMILASTKLSWFGEDQLTSKTTSMISHMKKFLTPANNARFI